MESFTPVASTLGGILIGVSAAALLLGIGRIAGVSGIFCGLLLPKAGDVAWRAAFVLGLLAGGLLMHALVPQLFGAPGERSLLGVAAAGLLVGFGTRMSNGCTSGHGVCGVSRGSPRSIVATLMFMATGAITVFVMRHLLGLGGTP